MASSLATPAVAAGTYRKQGTRWVIANGGVRPRRGRDLKGRCLSFAEREQIGLVRAAGTSVRGIAAQLERVADQPGAAAQPRVGRWLSGQLGARDGLPPRVAAQTGEAGGEPGAAGQGRAGSGEEVLEQITGRLLVEFPDDPEMRVSPETIYQSIYVQSRGALRRDLALCLRTGRALRCPSRKVGQRKNRIPNMINIVDRPAEVEDRAV